jgi:Ca2+-binding RTX toxin-like protein
MGESGYVIPLKNKAMLTRTALGYLYRAGQQDSHLVITLDDAGLHFADTGTKELVKLAGSCTRTSAKKGIAAVCKVPPTVSELLPLLVEIWPRLGDDYTDGSSLPDTVALTMLADEGDDVALFGAGPDFFNGHMGHDRVVGGGGNDWIRAGLGDDSVYGDAGDDLVIGMEGDDVLRGGTGDDRLGGMEDDDKLVGGAGLDTLLCGDGLDTAVGDALDKIWDCETLDLG